MIGRARLVLVGAVGAAIVGLAMLRRRADAAGVDPRTYANRGLRRFVTHRFNPAVERLGLVGGRRSPWAMIEHVGRVSGTVRRTPVLPRMTETAVYVPLPYGDDVQWARNVLAAGRCRLQVHEHTHDLDEPRVISARENPTLHPWLRELDARRGRDYLALRRVADIAGAFAPLRDEAPAGTAEPALPPMTIEPAPEAPLEPAPVPAGSGR